MRWPSRSAALLNAEYPARELIELGRLCESLWHGGT
jgi:hypothetical protein